jgi:hypothetical protein
MFANLLLSLALFSGTPAIVGHSAVEKVENVAVAGPSCITGPIRVRLRTQGGTVQIAANAIRVEGVDHPADAKAQPDR